MCLQIPYSDEDNEFQCGWIELLNEKRPNVLVVGVYSYSKKKSLVSIKTKTNTDNM